MSNQFDGDVCPALSPDGTSLAWYRVSNRRTLLTKRPGEAESLEVTSPDNVVGRARSLAWSPDGSRLIFAISGSIQGRGTSRLMQILTSGGSPEPVPGVTAGAATPVVSRSGNRLAYARVHSDSNIWRADLDGLGGGAIPRRKLAPSTRAEMVPRISPNGEKVVFVSDRANENRQIWVCDADGRQLKADHVFRRSPSRQPPLVTRQPHDRFRFVGGKKLADVRCERRWGTSSSNHLRQSEQPSC